MGNTATTVEAGKKALERHAWAEALTQLKQADEARELDAEGLEMLADAAWWMAEPPVSVAARERAYAGFVSAGNKERATRAALRLAQESANKAARIGGAAEAGEILVSAETLEGAKATYPVAKRSLTLKDITEPVEVAAIDWR